MARTKLEIKMEYDRKYRNFQKVLRRARKQGLVINVDYQKPQEITEGSIRRLDKVAEDVKYDLERQRIQKAREGRNLLREEQFRTKKRERKRQLERLKAVDKIRVGDTFPDRDKEKEKEDVSEETKREKEAKRRQSKARNAAELILKNIESNLREIENELKTAEGLISHAAMMSSEAYKSNILKKAGIQLYDVGKNPNSEYARLHGPVLYAIFNAKIMQGTDESKEVFCKRYIENILDWNSAISILRYSSDQKTKGSDMVEAYNRIKNIIMEAADMVHFPETENGLADIPEYLEYAEAPDVDYYGEEYF